MKYAYISFFIVLIITLLLSIAYLINKGDINFPINLFRQSGSDSRVVNITLTSEDPEVKMKLVKPKVLNEYALKLGLIKGSSVAIPRYETGSAAPEVNFINAKSIRFIFKPDQQKIIDIESAGNAVLTFSVEEKNEEVNIFFNYLPVKDKSYSEEELNNRLTSIIVRLLYRVTHYLPKAEYKYDDLMSLLSGLEGGVAFVEVQK